MNKCHRLKSGMTHKIADLALLRAQIRSGQLVSLYLDCHV